MSISRINKLIHETSRSTESLAEAAKRREVPVQIVVGNANAHKNAVMAHAATDLALRTFDGPVHVFLGNDHGLGLFSGVNGLGAELGELERRYGSSTRIELMQQAPIPSLPTIRIGTPQGPGLLVDAAGWVAAINRPILTEAPAEAPAAIFAVACVFARIFKSAILGISDDDSSWTFDLLRFATPSRPLGPYEPKRPALGRIALLGAGAIGSSFGYVLRYSEFSAHLDVIDFDHFEEPNQETSMLIGRPDALEGRNKAQKVADVLAGVGGVTINPHPTRVGYKSSILEDPRDIFVCGVDNSETREILDGVNAPLLLNGGLGGTALDAGHVLITRHQATDRPLSELYSSTPHGNVRSASSRTPTEFVNDECSRHHYQSVSLAAPFVALACGSLLVSACVQHALGLDPKINYFKIDLFGMQAAMDRRFLQPSTRAVG